MRQFFKNLLGIQTIYKQELLLNKAIGELGFNHYDYKIQVNHKTGRNYINDYEFGIIYPISFFEKAIILNPNSTKNIDFYFNGFIYKKGGRSILLDAFINKKDSLVIESNDGRIKSRKDKFNIDYFEPFTRSKFGLCPVHIDWDGPKKYTWTYRFIESLMCNSIPILFEETPLSDQFTDGFFFHTINAKIKDVNFEYDFDKVKANRKLALKKFTLTKELLKKIK